MNGRSAARALDRIAWYDRTPEKVKRARAAAAQMRLRAFALAEHLRAARYGATTTAPFEYDKQSLSHFRLNIFALYQQVTPIHKRRGIIRYIQSIATVPNAVTLCDGNAFGDVLFSDTLNPGGGEQVWIPFMAGIWVQSLTTSGVIISGHYDSLERRRK